MRGKKLVVANWKMNPLTQKEAEKLFGDITKNLSALRKTEVVICPPFVYLSPLKKLSRKIYLGAQDAFWGDVGAFTGEVSTEMLYELGARYVILGHSERSGVEDRLIVNKKLKSALASGLTPILCVGEYSRDEEHSYFNFVKEMLETSLGGVSKNSIGKIIIAYEPVWAISSTPNRRDATPEDSHEMAIFIRKILADKFGKESAKIKILYGGSANERDAGEFISRGGVDGFLVGRASLSAEKFSTIVNIVDKI